jgi:hypothetical protein
VLVVQLEDEKQIDQRKPSEEKNRLIKKSL